MSMNFGNPEVLEAVPNEITIKPAVIGGAAGPSYIAGGQLV
jgi:hypothetical protein